MKILNLLKLGIVNTIKLNLKNDIRRPKIICEKYSRLKINR